MGIGPSTKETSLHHFRDPLLHLRLALSAGRLAVGKSTARTVTHICYLLYSVSHFT